MAIATKNSHVARAIEFFKRTDKYFGIGRTSVWDNEQSPPAPVSDVRDIDELVGLKKVDNSYLVVPDNTNGTIEYRGSNWRIIPEKLSTTLSAAVTAGSFTIKVTDLLGISIGSKLRVGNLYDATVQSIDTASKSVVLDKTAPQDFTSGASVEGGAYVEGARWCYVDTYLRYDQFPLVTYREVGVYTYTTPSNLATMLSKAYAAGGKDEYTYRGVLEVIDNRKPTPRDQDQKEQLALIVEF